MAKVRLDKLLVDRGLCQSRERARALIMAGKVLVKGMPATKAGTQVTADAEVTLKEQDHPWVSRGALKLVKALDEFDIDPKGKVAIDVGASTGGFTDVLLSRGATRVFAIDVGYGQLDWKLRNDGRVVVLERENIRYLDPDKLDATPELAVIDVSFISLTLVLPKVRELLAEPGRTIVALIKPQFEAGKDQVGKGGVVREPEIRQQCIDKVQTFARHHGFEVGPVVESPIKGPAGNVEFLQRLETA
ncbi:MAG: TlyA family RNA methyltransferase [Deltaproteobacteria bacterium]|nr:TlyA family RNA methyltransferase [Deltaproteobacteria bacterium]